MAVDFLTGFEHGVASANGTGLFDAISGGASLPTTDVRTGTYNFDVAAAGGAFFVRKNHTGRNHLVVRGYVFLDTLPAGGTRGQLHSTLIGTSYGNIQIDSAGVVYASFRTSGHVVEGSEATGPTLSTGVHYRLDIHYDMSTSPNVIRWQVDGVAQTDASFTNAARTCTNSNWGQVNTTATYSFKIDDWIQGDASTNYPFGAGEIVGIVPSADGTHSFTANDFSTGDAGTLRAPSYTDFYLMVDELPWSATRSATDNICQRVIRTTGYVELVSGASPNPGETATAVRAIMGYSSSGTAANTAGCIVRSSAGFAGVLWGDLPVAQGGNGGALADYSESSNLFKGVIVTAPGSGWTESEVEAVRFRFGGAGDITPLPTLQTIMLEVAYPDTAVATVPRYPAINHANPGVLMKGIRRAWHRRRSRIFIPDLWLPRKDVITC